MAWMMDTYSQQTGFAQPGVVTGKPVDIGGSLGRTSSTGYGVIICAEKARQSQGKEISGATIAIQGFGNVGKHAAELGHQLGAKIVAVSDVSGGVYNGNGLNVPELIAYVNENKSLEGYADAEKISNEQLLELDVDVLAPCALDGVINENNAERVKASIIVEGANGPTTVKAGNMLSEKGVIIVPDILANGGGVIVSYFEWVQDIANYYWDEDQVFSNMKKTITRAFDRVLTFSKEENVDMRAAAMAVAVKHLEKAMLLRGLYPR